MLRKENPWRQSKLESALESSANMAFGFIISMTVWAWVVKPLYDHNIVKSAVLITAIFTVTSWIRTYVIRRFFDARLHLAVRRVAGWLISKGWVNADKAS